ncbi:MAG: HD domain-containing protein [Thermoplasmata archaeon]|nr:MAG: metal-dependent phosphohydrolase [Aciduliprofundum sp.]
MEFKIIHDSIHGSIRIEDPLLSLLETPEVQRMSNVRQLGLNYLVFPGANHTRLEHSIGVSHVAGELGSKIGLDERSILLLKISGLLHDIGHPPFSHAIEEFIHRRTGLYHEEIGERIIKGDLDIIGEYPGERKSIQEILEDNSIEKEDVISIIKFKKNDLSFNEHNTLGEIISGDLDADQIDYLLRDAHYTGVAYGIIDIQRIYNTISILDGEVVFDIKGKEALEGLMVARSLMYSSVYFHKTARIAELMVTRALEKLDMDPFRLVSMNDSELISMLINSQGFPREIGLRIKYRNLFKRAYYLEEIPEGLKKLNPEKIENEIADESGVPRDYVIVDMPMNGLSRFSSLDVNMVKNGRIRRLSDESRLVKAIRSRKPVDYDVMVITEKKYVDKVNKVAKRILV